MIIIKTMITILKMVMIMAVTINDKNSRNNANNVGSDNECINALKGFRLSAHKLLVVGYSSASDDLQVQMLSTICFSYFQFRYFHSGKFYSYLQFTRRVGKGSVSTRSYCLWRSRLSMFTTLIAWFVGPTWDPSGTDRTQVRPMLAPWTLLCGCILTIMCWGWGHIDCFVQNCSNSSAWGGGSGGGHVWPQRWLIYSMSTPNRLLENILVTSFSVHSTNVYSINMTKPQETWRHSPPGWRKSQDSPY